MQDKSTSRRRGARLARGHRLAQVCVTDGDVLSSPAGTVQLNSTAAAILALCDGTRTREQIVTYVVDAADDGGAEDVRAFIDSAARRGWILGG